MLPRRSVAFVGSSAILMLVAIVSAKADGNDTATGMIHEGFESTLPAWRQEQTDATVTLHIHDRSSRAAHEGRLSEHFQFTSGAGSSFIYSFPLAKIPINEALKVNLFVRSTRGGLRIMGRVVLPSDTDPETGQPSFVLIPGTIYDQVDRWQRLELSNMLPSIERQARVLRAATRRPVSLEGAYLDQLAINLFGGEGETEAFIDDLTIGPVSNAVIAEQAQPVTPGAPSPVEPESKPANRSNARVQLVDGQLRKRADDGKDYDWVFTAIDAPGANVELLRKSGFDVLSTEIDDDPKRIQEAIRRGFLLAPNLNATLEGRAVEADRMVSDAKGYPYQESVAFWNLGEQLGRSRDVAARNAELERIRSVIAGLRGLPENVSHLTTATVAGELPLYSSLPRNLSIMGIKSNFLSTAIDPQDGYAFLKQRRDLTALSNPKNLFCTWIPATISPTVKSAIWGKESIPEWGNPQVHPEQLRLYTYLALGAGYRGIGFKGDETLTGRAGRMLLIEMALLNEEIDLCEGILARGKDPIPFYKTFPPDPPTLPQPGSKVNQRMPVLKELEPTPGIRAAGISTRDRKGILLLVADYSGSSQFVPAQMSMNELKITVPVPESAQAFEISPGDVRTLERERSVGGARFTIPEFGPTSLILITTDFEMADRLRSAIARVRPFAVNMAIEQAELRLQEVSQINDILVRSGKRLYDKTDPKTMPLPDGAPEPNDEYLLLQKAEESIKSAREALEREEYSLAWSEARRAHRPLRHLMSAQWQKAYESVLKKVVPEDPKPPPTQLGRLNRREIMELEREKLKRTRYLTSPVMCPPLLSYNTLPLVESWLNLIQQPFGPNLVPKGSFDDHTSLESGGWIDQSHRFKGIVGKVSTTVDETDREKRLLKLTVEPIEKMDLDKFPPYLDFPAAAIRSPSIRVQRDQFYRISMLVKKVNPSPAGTSGIIITDSIGGEVMQHRFNGSYPKLSRVVFYRRAPTSGDLTVTMGLSNFGEAFFDDFRIEKVDMRGTNVNDDMAGQGRDPRQAQPEPEPTSPATANRPLSGSRSSQ